MRNKQHIQIGQPMPNDGMALHRLVTASPPLDVNSVYCNLLQCTHFNETAVCARQGEDLVGFISGYLLPQRPDTLFVWQVVVAESVRGQGLALSMLNELLNRPACGNVAFVETTITASNTASQALFRKWAAQLSAGAVQTPCFDKHTHFEGQHESELLWRIGPIPNTETRRRI